MRKDLESFLDLPGHQNCFVLVYVKAYVHKQLIYLVLFSYFSFVHLLHLLCYLAFQFPIFKQLNPISSLQHSQMKALAVLGGIMLSVDTGPKKIKSSILAPSPR